MKLFTQIDYRLTRTATGSGGVVYHASPLKMDVLTPRTDHGDPDVPAAVFATPYLAMALAYVGKKWGNRDIEQGYRDDGAKWTLREMRPGAFKDIYGPGTDGYLYELPAGAFHRPERSQAMDMEVISTKPVKPIAVRRVGNPYEELVAAGVEMIPYEADDAGYQEAVERMAKRGLNMDSEELKKHLDWIRETNPELADRMSDEIKTSETTKR